MGYAPTKVRMFLANVNGGGSYQLQEIPLKTVSDKRLVHYGVTEDSTVFIMASHDTFANSNFKQELKSLALKALRCSDVSIEVT
jgi:hypothetical protein